MEGWIKLYRDLGNKPIWLCSTPEQKVVLITLLTMTNYRDVEWEWNGNKYTCKAGQFITSLDSIAKKSGKGITIQNVRSALKKFEKYEFLTNESTKTGRLITIVNWELYQSEEEKATKVATKSQQRGNKEVTTNKNNKKEKKDKNIIYKDLSFIDDVIVNVNLTEEQYQKLYSKFGAKLLHDKINAFNIWVIGKESKDHYLTLNNWCKKEEPTTGKAFEKRNAPRPDFD